MACNAPGQRCTSQARCKIEKRCLYNDGIAINIRRLGCAAPILIAISIVNDTIQRELGQHH
jgi:hypothetical protein